MSPITEFTNEKQSTEKQAAHVHVSTFKVEQENSFEVTWNRAMQYF